MIVGAGALGRLFAARLASRHTVTLIGRSGPVHRLSWQGSGGAYQQLEFGTTDGAPPDIVMIATKSYDVLAALEPLTERIPATTPLLLIQNGFHAQPRLHDLWPGPVLCATTTEAAYRPAPPSEFDVVHAATGHTWIGDLAGCHLPLSARVADALVATGITATACADIRQRLWQKLAINAVINPLTARDRVLNGALLAPAYDSEIASLVGEIADLMAAESIAPPESGWRALVDGVIDATANNRSSMLQDRLAGRRTERDAILGPLLDAAKRHHLKAPALRTLLHQTPD
ncbi:putative 2-dehydropantoate 2-reductase [Salinicola rhizosphaerae]|uniref:2-dehydropantoate 2-reductase n=2 Tax=Salinicola rhizosphaerae TaxID=1443141 RepID=A0ABQ3DQ93_9GAMM|nr:putative 2-dehydropantoate 2-reductase [Salinicola rhizosphaerae]